MGNEERARIIKNLAEYFGSVPHYPYRKPYNLSFGNINLYINEDGVLSTKNLLACEIPWDSLGKEYVGYDYKEDDNGFKVRLLETKYVKILSRNVWPESEENFKAEIKEIEEMAVARYDWIGEYSFPKKRRIYLIKEEYLDELFGICFEDESSRQYSEKS